MLSLSVLLGGLLLLSITGAAQLPLGGFVEHPLGYIANDKLSAPPQSEGSLRALSADEYTTFTHPSVPSYGLRIKQSPAEFCDPTVKSYTGYLDVDYGAKHMFFYFFESRNDPDTDDVLMWINGGPGCSEYSVMINPWLDVLKPRLRP